MSEIHHPSESAGLRFSEIIRFTGRPAPIDRLDRQDEKLKPLLSVAANTHLIRSSLGQGTCFEYYPPLDQEDNGFFITVGHVLPRHFIEYARSQFSTAVFPKILRHLAFLLSGPEMYQVKIAAENPIVLGPEALSHYLFTNSAGVFRETHAVPKTSILTPARTHVSNRDAQWTPEQVQQIKHHVSQARHQQLLRTDIALLRAPQNSPTHKESVPKIMLHAERILAQVPTMIAKSDQAKEAITRWAKEPIVGFNGLIPRDAVENQECFVIGFPSLSSGNTDKMLIPLGKIAAFKPQEHTMVYKGAQQNWTGISGSPVVLADGRVIGVASFITPETGEVAWDLHIVDLAYQLNLLGELT